MHKVISILKNKYVPIDSTTAKLHYFIFCVYLQNSHFLLFNMCVLVFTTIQSTILINTTINKIIEK